MSSARILVFGAAGQLGVEVANAAEARGCETARITRAEADIGEPAAAEKVASLRPDFVFNCAAYNQVDAAESDPQTALSANALGVRNLAVACRDTGAVLVHFSTDYVFDGDAGRPYRETDPTHPLGAYAVSKLAGELYAQAYLDRVLVIRTSGVFGPAGRKTSRSNFVEVMLRLAQGSQPVRVVEDHVASPTYAPALASRSLDLALLGENGLFHIGGGEAISWFDYARKIFAKAGVSPDLRATNRSEFKTAARRPLYSALDNARLATLPITPMPALDEALAAYMDARGKYL